MDKYDIERTHAESKWDKAMLQITGWLLVLSIVGVVLTVVLAILKTAVYSMIIAGSICLLVALLAMWGYHALKLGVQRRVYDHDMRQLQQQLEQKQSHQ